MALKPSYLVLTGVGVLIAVSGLKGWTISKSFQDIIRGQSPSKSPVLTAQITSAQFAVPGGTGTGTSGGTGGHIVTPTGPGETAWFTALLLGIGAPPTPANLSSLHNWRSHESPWNALPPDGAQYTHNPLNTTLATKNVVGNVNSIGVRIYSSAVAGIAATAATLLGGYPAIVSAFRHGVGLSTGDPGVASELLKWSGGGYSSV